MNPKKYVENWVRGWLPKEPISTSLTRLTAQNSLSVRIGGLLLPALGALLIAIYSYSTLLTLYDYQFAFSIAWFLFVAYLVGIELAIIGVTLRVRSTGLNTLPLRKPYLVAGLLLLTISVFGNILNDLVGGLSIALNVTYPYSNHSLLVRLVKMAPTGWLSTLPWWIGFAGWLILFIGGSARLNLRGASNLLKGGYYALALGSIITFAGSVMRFVYALPEMPFAFAFIYELVFFYFAYLQPLGVVCLTYGWAVITSTHLRKSPYMLTALYAAFLALTTILFLIPI